MSIEADKTRILVADDEELIRNVFRMILKAKLPEIHADIAVNGEEAVNLFKNHHHAAIVMDIHMPVKDGVQAYQDISDICIEKNWDMPSFTFCTGYQPPDVLKDIVTENSPHTVVAKPVLAETLVKEIKKSL